MMSAYLCPDCRQPIEPASSECPSGHQYTTIDGVLVLVSGEFGSYLNRFIEVLRDYRDREGKRLLDASIYDQLPYVRVEGLIFDWRVRRYDLDIIRRLTAGLVAQRVLDIGSYNGWLSHHLSRWGHDVTAIDYFSDPYDGLGARRFYSRANWRSIQMDLADLDILEHFYDVVILNRCLQFFPDPEMYLHHAAGRVAEGGLLIATGLEFYRDPRCKQRFFAQLQCRYKKHYGIDFFLRPTRGFLDFTDRRNLHTGGVEIRHYPQLWKRNLLSLVVPTRPRFCYGVLRRAD